GERTLEQRISKIMNGVGWHPANSERLEQQRETTVRRGPGDVDGMHAAVGAIRSRNAAYDHGLELHGVEMPPRSFVGVILQRPNLPALGATARALGMVTNTDLDAQAFQIEIHGLNQPVFSQTEQQSIMVGKIVHAVILGKTSVKYQPQQPQPRKLRKNHEGERRSCADENRNRPH
ncbi:MAG: hypothetical protein WEB58_17415, partial [Planctomycetaceae bacterium]